jgi:hypothetical protein
LLLLSAQAIAVDGQAEIDSAGPLSRIIVSTDLNCQVAHQADSALELYGADVGACGTYLAVNGELFGPAYNPSGSFTLTPWTPVSQSSASGSGTSADPYRIVTVVDAGSTGLRVEQTDSYVAGTQAYRTEVRITNRGSTALSGVLYRAGDCFLQEHDEGYGRVDGGAPACVVDASSSSRIEQWLPTTPGSHLFEGNYRRVWALIDAQGQFPDSCECGVLTDNGAGLSWPVSIAAGGSAIVSHQTFFSPLGGSPVGASFRQSVPDPLHISLDPVVVAESVAVTAGVMVLVPFPSALFNRTLEENYEEVMAAVARLSGWFAALLGSIAGSFRRGGSGREPPVLPLALDPSRLGGVSPYLVIPPPAPDSTGMPQVPQVAAAAAPKLDIWRTPQGMLGFTLLTALLYGFLDPTFGFSLESLATYLGLAAGLILARAAYGIPLYLMTRRYGVRISLRALPASLLIAVGCVVVSRLADFQPGYLYGAVIGFLFAHDASESVQGNSYAVAIGVSLAAALVAWLALIVVRNSPGDLGSIALEEAAVTVVVAGLEGAVFELLPLRFMPGGRVFASDRRVWLVLIGLGIFGFAHVLLNPASGYLADTTRTSFFTMVALLVAFGLASVVFWGYFRFRPRRQTPRTSGAAAG